MSALLTLLRATSLSALNIVELMGQRELAELTQTDLELELSRRVHDVLSPFVGNVDAFNAVLETNGGLVTGSAALKVVLGSVTWSPQDLDIAVPENEPCEVRFTACLVWS